MPEGRDDEIPFGSAEWDNRLESRRGRPAGPHVRQHDDSGPPSISDYIRGGDTTDLRKMLEEIVVGNSSPSSKLDVWKYIAGGISVVGLIITVAGSAQHVVESNQTVAASNQRLLDKVDGMDSRVAVLEKGRAENLPKITSQLIDQANENKNQNDRLTNISEALNAERIARNQDTADARKAQSDILALIAKVADKLADVVTDVAVMRASGRRTDAAPLKQQQDAQAAGPKGSSR